ncbi:MAG: phasin family protein [Pelatocladus maniniholoensis HA4357-MV3]|jgi:polyhydroxyalkanoate synthesis regulator phasin|uniref:Phasin family protein n=1 Tax=Pelatocladus maniniholoensis HA4357-MV3 TaxID=1117104 RepID=A0A9E3HAL2_9NOST|nr:phasin family protein [Pelatocladus maniniholoensis HA4357-MV3]BAZ69703.1 hypothetical protein NIES4106_44810 [Fischerella sp. NIES-4106]
MAGFGDIVKKAFYLGVGLASYAGERAGGTLSEVRSQIQKLADEMVARGEMTTEEARRFVEEMMKQAQQQAADGTAAPTTTPSEPRRIEIIEEDEQPTAKDVQGDNENVEQLRQQVLDLENELKRLQRDN